MTAVLDHLFERFATASSSIAFIDRSRIVTYSDLLEATDVAATWLKTTGVRPGDIAVVLGDYSPDVFALLLALMRNGSTIVPVTAESVVELGTILELSEARWGYPR